MVIFSNLTTITDADFILCGRGFFPKEILELHSERPCDVSQANIVDI